MVSICPVSIPRNRTVVEITTGDHPGDTLICGSDKPRTFESGTPETFSYRVLFESIKKP
jgi:hypothetical protein